ncbi:MAG TPA: lysine exporter LysO family protein [Tepiditoga sp.]|nr:lysine exporter LysO family protein [Thermotogota bacterium]HOO74410.1 lysine exporter LysO family protein [Tepiditoga sp.]
MILLIISVISGFASGYFSDIKISENLITVLLMLLVFFVGIDIGSEEKIFIKIKSGLKKMFIQSFLTMTGSLIFGSAVSFFTTLNFREALGASAGFGWYSLSGVMISNFYSPELGAVSFTSNVIRELMAILLIPFVAKFTQLGAISIGGATTMDTMLGVVSANTSKENTLIGFGQGVIISLSVPVIISLIF